VAFLLRILDVPASNPGREMVLNHGFGDISHCHRPWPDYWVVTNSIPITSNLLISNYSKLLRGSVSTCILKEEINHYVATRR